MTKKKIITALLISAAVCTAATCYLVYQSIAPSRGTIYVFNAPYEAGEQITESMLSPLQVDTAVILAGKKSDVANQFVTPTMYRDIVSSGDSLRMDVGEGMPLIPSMLSVAGGSNVEQNMKSDSVAVTVPVDRFSGITNALKAGARVNVYACINSQVELIQQNKRVLEVFSDGANIVGVSIEEDSAESMQLIYAAAYGEIYLGLVDSTGYQALEGETPVYPDYSDYIQDDTIDDFMDGYSSFDETEITEPEESTEAGTGAVPEEDTTLTPAEPASAS